MKSQSKLVRLSQVVFCLWVIAQIVLVFLFWNMPDGPDERGYVTHALANFANGTTYPSRLNLYDQYIQSPGMVNYFIFQHILFGTTTFHIDRAINIILNVCIVLEIYWLAKRFFNERTASLAVILYCVTTTNIFAPVMIITELPYLFLALSGFCLSLGKRWYAIAIASVIFGIAHTFRPLVLAFMVCSVIFYVIRKRPVWNYALVIVPYLLVLLSVGFHNKANTGYFVTSSTTGGYNLIMTANDHAMARPDFSTFSDTTNIAYIPHREQVTFAAKDSIYKARAISWIKDHKLKYAGLYVEKIVRLWAGDTWSIPALSKWDNYDYIVTQPDNGRLLLIRRGIQAVEGLAYYLIIIAFFVSLVKYRREILSAKGLFLLLILLGTAGTCLFTVEVRFHYPYYFAVVLWAAYGLARATVGKASSR